MPLSEVILSPQGRRQDFLGVEHCLVRVHMSLPLQKRKRPYIWATTFWEGSIRNNNNKMTAFVEPELRVLGSRLGRYKHTVQCVQKKNVPISLLPMNLK